MERQSAKKLSASDTRGVSRPENANWGKIIVFIMGLIAADHKM